VVKLDEQTLRTRLAAPDGRGCGFQIMNSVLQGEPLTIRLNNGEERRFARVADAMNHLREFGWSAAPPKGGRQPASEQ
jgi:hypothetical protein